MEENKNTVPTGQEGEGQENWQEGKEGEGKELNIPKSRFDEVNNKKKELEEKLKQFEDKEKADQIKKLEEEGKLKEVYELKIKEYEAEKEVLRKEALNNKKEALIAKHWIPDKLLKYVTGNSVEEIEESIKELKETFEEFKKEDKSENKNKIPEKEVKKEAINDGLQLKKGTNNVLDAIKNAKKLN